MMGWEVLWLVIVDSGYCRLFISGKHVAQRRLEQHHVPLRGQTRWKISLWSLAYTK